MRSVLSLHLLAIMCFFAVAGNPATAQPGKEKPDAIVPPDAKLERSSTRASS